MGTTDCGNSKFKSRSSIIFMISTVLFMYAVDSHNYILLSVYSGFVIKYKFYNFEEPQSVVPIIVPLFLSEGISSINLLSANLRVSSLAGGA